MNLEDYEPSLPVEDRRAQYLRGSGRFERRGQQARTLLDLMGMEPPQPYQYQTGPAASGLADVAGYNMIGRRPLQPAPYRMPSMPLNSPLDPRFIGGTGGPIRY